MKKVDKKDSLLFVHDNKLFKALIENSWDMILLVDAKMKILYGSPSTVRLFGRGYEEFIGHNGIKFVHPIDVPRAVRLFGQILVKPENPIRAQMRVRHKNGHYLWVEAVAINLLSDENVQGVVVNVHDITALKHSEEKKDAFISIASHELKTPITSLKVYIQILQLGMKITEGKKEDFLQKMANQVTRLERLVNDLYETSKIRESKLSLKMEKFLLVPLIQEIAEDVQRNNNSHTIDISARFEGFVTADKLRIHQVISNILSNAIKFSPKAKEIKIMIWKENDTIFVSITDYGIGVAKENISQITERFFQANEKNRYGSGLGLGLYISRNIIKQHGGDLKVESKFGKSTTVTISLPKKTS